MAVGSIFFPGLQGGSSPLLGAMGAKPPDTPAIGMEARKGGDAAGGSVHDSPAASGGSPKSHNLDTLHFSM